MKEKEIEVNRDAISNWTICPGDLFGPILLRLPQLPEQGPALALALERRRILPKSASPPRHIPVPNADLTSLRTPKHRPHPTHHPSIPLGQSANSSHTPPHGFGSTCVNSAGHMKMLQRNKLLNVRRDDKKYLGNMWGRKNVLELELMKPRWDGDWGLLGLENMKKGNGGWKKLGGG